MKHYAKVVFLSKMPRWLDRSPESVDKGWTQAMGTKNERKGNRVAVCGSLSQRLSNAVISNAHTPLITQPVCVTGLACWMAL